MKCQILFSGKNKKNIIKLSSAENAKRVVKVNGLNVKLYYIFPLLLHSGNVCVSVCMYVCEKVEMDKIGYVGVIMLYGQSFSLLQFVAQTSYAISVRFQ